MYVDYGSGPQGARDEELTFLQRITRTMHLLRWARRAEEAGASMVPVSPRTTAGDIATATATAAVIRLAFLPSIVAPASVRKIQLPKKREVSILISPADCSSRMFRLRCYHNYEGAVEAAVERRVDAPRHVTTDQRHRRSDRERDRQTHQFPRPSPRRH